MKIKPSQLRRMVDMALVEQTRLVLCNKPYEDNINPYEVGTLRHGRFRLHYERAIKKEEALIRDFDKMFES